MLQVGESKQQVGLISRYWIWVVAVIVFCALGFQLGKTSIKVDIEEQARAKQTTQNLISENERLNADLNKLKIEKDVLKLSLENTKESLSQALDKTSDLRQQVSFYQRVMAPEMTQDGFVVERAEITKNASENNYSIKLMLLQQENIKAVIKGQLKVVLLGSLNGKASSMNVDQLRGNPTSPLAFAFKYFQVIEFNITVPDGFVPERFEISTDVYKYNRKRGSYSTSISWREALAEEPIILD
ncbi:DUF6776 family protein [Glaciecola sp. 1036]|uniref:DUF6776 family protein n=1 Tax=Alteromonadaceae TaxID=72275 RepID=UPI003D093C9F